MMGQKIMTRFHRNDIIGINQLRLETVQSGIPRSFTIEGKDHLYQLNEYGNYVDNVFPDIDNEIHQLSVAILGEQVKKRKELIGALRASNENL